MVSFLKKAGSILATVIGAITGLSPEISALLGQYNSAYGAKVTTVSDTFVTILQKALDVEVAFAAVYPNAQTGPQKLQALTALIAPVISEIETIKGKKIANATLYTQALNEIATGAADLLNAFEGGS